MHSRVARSASRVQHSASCITSRLRSMSARPAGQPKVPAKAAPSNTARTMSGDDDGDGSEVESTSLTIFSDYTPVNLGGGEHPAALVETTGMASVHLLRPLQRPFDVPPPGLSNVQLEAVALATAAHDDEEARNVFGTRRGFFLADGTGCGKGRTIAGTILLSLKRGRLRNVWVSGASDLLHDARRDFDGLEVQGSSFPIQAQHAWKELAQIDMDAGTLFTTYSLLCRPSRLEQLQVWCGGAFDGVIALDEVHKVKSATAPEDSSAFTKSARALLSLQECWPDARMLYVSATGADNVLLLGQLSRLHMWGGDSPFPTPRALIEALGSGEGSAELLAMDLKARGVYQSRHLSFAGVELLTQTLPLSSEQRVLYDAAAALWVELLRDAPPKFGVAASRYFWGAHQRFFQQLILSFKIAPAAVAVREAVDAGFAAVVGLQSTGAAAASAAKARAQASSSDSEGDEDLTGASSCLELMLRTIEKLEYRDSDSERFKTAAMALGLPPAALPMLIEALGGPEHVAELTGRTAKERRGGASRAAVSNLAELQAFNDGQKQVAIISAAASTGISLHADPGFGNVRRRAHFTLELPWAAAPVVQQVGRTHRASQTTAPRFIMLASDAPGELRKATTIAARLSQLGALRGDQRAGVVGVNLSGHADDLTTPLGRLAFRRFWKRFCWGEAPEGARRVLAELGFEKEMERVALPKEATFNQFLNRIMGAPLSIQHDLLQGIGEEMAVRTQRYADMGLSIPQGGVRRIVGSPLPEPPETLRIFQDTASGAVDLHTVRLDMGLPFQMARTRRDMYASQGASFYLQRADDAADKMKTRRALLVTKLWTPTRRDPAKAARAKELKEKIDALEVAKDANDITTSNLRQEHEAAEQAMAAAHKVEQALPPETEARVMFANGEIRVWTLAKLQVEYARVPDDNDVAAADVMAAWQAELADEATRERGRRTVGVLTGSLLARLRELQPYLTTSKALSNDEDAKEESPILMEGVGPVQDLRENHVHFEIVKLPMSAGPELLGLLVPASRLAELRDRAPIDARNS
jgi:hypothetical protein